MRIADHGGDPQDRPREGSGRAGVPTLTPPGPACLPPQAPRPRLSSSGVWATRALCTNTHYPCYPAPMPSARQSRAHNQFRCAPLHLESMARGLCPRRPARRQHLPGHGSLLCSLIPIPVYGIHTHHRRNMLNVLHTCRRAPHTPTPCTPRLFTARPAPPPPSTFCWPVKNYCQSSQRSQYAVCK